LPAGQYDRVENVVLEQEVPVPGITASGIDLRVVVDVFLAPIAWVL